MKKGIALIAALLIVLTMPLSASAEEIVGNGNGYSVIAGDAAAVSEDKGTAATGEGIDNTAEVVAAEYPVIQKIENTADGAKITWETFENNLYYRVYYRKAKTDDGTWDEKYVGVEWKRLDTVKGNSYVHPDPADGELGIYTVRSVSNSGDFTSDFYHQGWENRYDAPPAIKELSPLENGVRVTWNRTKNAAGYRLYRKSDGDWTELVQTDADTYTDTAVTSGTEYTYSVRAVDADGETFLGDYGSSKKLLYVSVPEITSIVNTEKGALITWAAAPGASRYRAYYHNGTTWVKMTETTDTGYLDTDAKEGATRTYTVRCLNNSSEFVSDFNHNGWRNTYYAPPVIQSVSYRNGAYVISWSGKSVFHSYSVFRRQLDSEDLTLIAENVTGTSFTDSTASIDRVYAYAVCAFDADGEAVTGLSANSSYYKNGNLVKNAVSGDDGVYRFESGEPDTGFFRENGTFYYYQNGKRVAQNWYKTGRYKTSCNRTKWLYELMTYTGGRPKVSADDSAAVFALAYQRGVITKNDPDDYNRAFDRLYVAHTLVRTLGYSYHSVGTVSDSTDKDMSTIAYYGYFIPDNNDKMYPKSLITPAEFDGLLSELRLYQQFHGKTVISFGDSIMYGSGNNNRGPCNMIREKYGMSFYDYSVPGATMGTYTGKSHIPDQVQTVVSKGRQPDLILLNGGTNDTFRTELGTVASGYDMSKVNESTFSGGFQKTMWRIRKAWGDVPVIYLRQHKMSLSSTSMQVKYGERGLEIAEKWKAAGVDLYKNSGFDGSVVSNAKRYTDDDDDQYRGIHPNALGYAKYYLPFICESIAHTIGAAPRGDADDDGAVTAVDAAVIQRSIVGIDVPVSDAILMQGDVDGNGLLEITDVTFIQRRLAGFAEPYAIGE